MESVVAGAVKVTVLPFVVGDTTTSVHVPLSDEADCTVKVVPDDGQDNEILLPFGAIDKVGPDVPPTTSEVFTKLAESG